ncbi:MAG: hypothetical protein PHY41_08030 [Candidatus Cloacimonetes bacterium]|nr:hypothetical protein [Candidatus Cloacimonadota bacterium]MDD3283405.1 hypothetical protein [Candidatus Cloacimonadota bacterium]
MSKRYLVLFLAILPILVFAQDMPFSVSSSTRYSASTMFGKVDIDSVRYTQFRFIQEFKYKKFGLGLDLDILLDKNYHIKKSDWDHLGDIIGKFYYFRYAELGDPLYFHIGGFPKYSVGNGLVMLNYSNMYFYPDLRYNGILIGGKIPTLFEPELELFSSDITKNNILSFRAHFKPLPDSTVKILDMSKVGFSVYTDLNQYANLNYTLPDSLEYLNPDRRDAATILSFDYTQPLKRSDKAEYGIYTEVAHMIDNGTGSILPGVYADFNVIKVNLEYRTNGDRFMPAYFDYHYEEERAVQDTLNGLPIIITKEEALQNRKSSYGFFGKVQGIIGDRLKAMFAWQNMYGADLENGKSMWFSLNVDTRYKRLEKIAFSYSKTNVSSLSLGKVAVPRASMSASATIGLDSKRRWFVIAKYSERYKDKEGGINWWKDTKRSAAVGVKFLF